MNRKARKNKVLRKLADGFVKDATEMGTVGAWGGRKEMRRLILSTLKNMRMVSKPNA